MLLVNTCGLLDDGIVTSTNWVVSLLINLNVQEPPILSTLICPAYVLLAIPVMVWKLIYSYEFPVNAILNDFSPFVE